LSGIWVRAWSRTVANFTQSFAGYLVFYGQQVQSGGDAERITHCSVLGTVEDMLAPWPTSARRAARRASPTAGGDGWRVAT
jgi:hypothetical protein